ncbi:Ent-kaurene synthase [Quillaja saponaria]|uniref:Ent-kaurene synthase n=1 Tax=Quillaja saponaria TaxID=32244 RepID=A0AAD7PB15_QUISA|nr:Ent-kaurene synthase [Quillaja saponaria]
MSLPTPIFPLSSTSSASASPMVGQLNVEKQIISKTLSFEGTKQRIQKMFDTVEHSVSSYDTAWVAMIPSPISPDAPFFPECLNWLLDNQQFDGSWGLTHRHPLLTKDSLLSTLACILALKQWGAGEKQMNRGLQFIESNFAFARDENQHSPIGFDIIFPALIEHAQNFGFKSPPWRNKYRSIDSQEGIGAEKRIRKQFRRNSGCLRYLQSLLEKFGNAVPTVYPLDIYARLCMVDTLERLGIHHHFREEIRGVLDETYRYWLQGEEDLFLDSTTCAMAFRLLTVNGYDVSSDPSSRYTEDKFSNSLEGTPGQDSSWNNSYPLAQYMAIHYKNVNHEVKDVLKFPYHANLDRLSNKRTIEQYKADNTRVLKTSYSCLNLSNNEFLKLAVEDFNICQSTHIKELKQLQRWFVEKRFDKLKFARETVAYCYFSAAIAFPEAEHVDARISWTKHAVLTSVVDDLFDLGGSEEETINLVQLVEKWNVDVSIDCCSEPVEIIFSALHNTICETAENAFKQQGRDVTSDVLDIWLDVIRAMLRETEWSRTKYVPRMDEYMDIANLSFALGPIVLLQFFLVGPKLSNDIFVIPEVNSMFELMNTCGRLLNDIQSFKREAAQGKLNAVTLRIIQGDGQITEEDAIKEVNGVISNRRRELLRLVLLEKNSKLPRVCKDLFWKLTKVLHLFYMKEDGYTSHGMIDTALCAISRTHCS